MRLSRAALPNLVANSGNPRCGAATRRAYSEGVGFAISHLATVAPQTAIYLDAGHGGWCATGIMVSSMALLWHCTPSALHTPCIACSSAAPPLVRPLLRARTPPVRCPRPRGSTHPARRLGWDRIAAAFLKLVCMDLEVDMRLVRGFATNIANYNPVGEPCPAEVFTRTTMSAGRFCNQAKNANHSCCRSDVCRRVPRYSSGASELMFVQTLAKHAREQCHTISGGAFTPRFIIDTSRAGNPHARSPLECHDVSRARRLEPHKRDQYVTSRSVVCTSLVPVTHDALWHCDHSHPAPLQRADTLSAWSSPHAVAGMPGLPGISLT